MSNENKIKIFRLGETAMKETDNVVHKSLLLDMNNKNPDLSPAPSSNDPDPDPDPSEDEMNADILNHGSENEPTENFPLHFTGTLELWAADMGILDQQPPCWAGNKKLLGGLKIVPKCM